MKTLLTLTSIASIGTALALLAACETTGTRGVVAQKESLLSQSGFKIITVTTPKQQQAVSGLAQGMVTAVTYNGKLYYVFPTAQKDRIYVGRQMQFNAYKQALTAQQTSQATNAAQAIALGAAAGLAAGSAAHQAQDRETVIIPAAGPGLQVPSWQPTNGTPLWHHEEYQAPKTYYTKPTWGGWVTTEQP